MNTPSARPVEFIQPYSDDEINLADLARALWQQRGLIMGCILFVIAAALTFHLSKLTFSAPHRVELPISLTFLSDRQEYPSGQPFSPNDLIAPSVLEQVVAQQNLSLTVEQLSRALNVSFSNSMFEAGEAQLTRLLANEKTPEDMRLATQQNLEQLRKKSRHLVTVTLMLDEAGLQQAQAASVIKDITDIWSQQSVRRGLMNINISYPMSPFVANSSLNLLDTYDSAAAYLRSLENSVRHLSALPGSNSLVVDGRTLDDMRRALIMLNDVDISPLREFAYSSSAQLADDDGSIRVRLLARQRLLNLEYERLEKLIYSYDAALSELVATSGEQVQHNTSGNQMMGSQFDQSFLDSMLELGNRLGGVEMRHDLFTRRTQAIEEALQLEKEIAILKGSLDGADYSGLDPHAILQGALEDIAHGLNHSQQQLSAFIAAYRNQALQSGGRLFIADANPIVRGGKLQVAKKASLHIALAVVLGGMLGIMLALIRGAVGFNQKKAMQ